MCDWAPGPPPARGEPLEPRNPAMKAPMMPREERQKVYEEPIEEPHEVRAGGRPARPESNYFFLVVVFFSSLGALGFL